MALAKSTGSSGLNTNPVFPFYNLILQGAHIGRENRQAETVSQEQDAALVDMPVGQDTASAALK